MKHNHEITKMAPKITLQTLNDSLPIPARRFKKGPIRSAYMIGLKEGRGQLQHTVNLLNITVGHLFKELTRLDRLNPLPDAPDIIRIRRVYLEKIIKGLRGKKHFSYANTLRKIIKEQNGNGSPS